MLLVHVWSIVAIAPINLHIINMCVSKFLYSLPQVVMIALGLDAFKRIYPKSIRVLHRNRDQGVAGCILWQLVHARSYPHFCKPSYFVSLLDQLLPPSCTEPRRSVVKWEASRGVRENNFPF